MQIFNSEFPISRNVSISDFNNAIHEWICGSPHTKISAADFKKALQSKSSGNAKSPHESVEWVSVSLPSSQNSSFRYLKIDSGFEWDTTITLHQDVSQSWIGVQVACSSTKSGQNIPSAKKPIIINQLLDKFGNGHDGEIQVSSNPINLGNDDIDFAADCINGERNVYLPIIYVSAKSSSSKFHHAVVPQSAAKSFCGMAHVLIEPNRDFSSKLMEKVNYKNPYAGSIAIIWPDTQKIIQITNINRPSKEIISSISELIIEENLKRRPRIGCTWAYVTELSAQNKIQELKKSNSKELDAYLELFDSEITALKQQKNEAEKEIEKLKNELLHIRSNTSTDSNDLIIKNTYKNAYSNEIKTVVLAAIKDAIKNTYSESRRLDILNDIIRENPITHDREKITSSIKNCLAGYSSLTKKIQDTLKEHGIEIKSEDGKHYKLEYSHDKKYNITMAKSASDHKAGKNLASDIIKILF